MNARNGRKARPPLDAEGLQRLALRYVERFATTQSKLRTYLARKVRERGWAGEGEPDLDAIVEQLAGLSYIDDAAYALSKSRSLSSRGYGAARVRLALRVAGVGDADAALAKAHAAENAVEAALRFAEKRRIGPYASERPDPRQRERALAGMIRAGHAFGLCKSILDMAPGEKPDPARFFDEGRSTFD
jgi:regulatory protein